MKGNKIARKILSGFLIGFSALLLVSSLVGVGVIWRYKDTLTESVDSKLANVDREMSLAQTTLQEAQVELERALRIVDSAEEALETFSTQITVARELLDTVTGVLDETIKPGLETSREKIDEVRKTLQDLRASIENLNRIPFVNIEIPDDGVLNSFVEITDSLESEILRLEGMADEASTFMSDTSYLMGGDFQETRENIQNLQAVVDEYVGRISGWRGDLDGLREDFPIWINRAAIWLTVFLLWFAFSQAGLFLHGLSIWRGGNPWEVLAGWRGNGK